MKRADLRHACLTVLALSAVGATLAGCAQRPVKAANKQKSEPTPIPRGIEGQGISVNWMENLKNGKAQPILDIKAASGSAATGSRSGKFNQAEGFFYQKGRRVLKFKAPQVDAAEAKRVVVASGRVRAESLEPAGVTIEADRVTWLPEKNKVVAEGAVTLRYQRPGESFPIAWGGPVQRMTIDTEMKKFSIP